MLQFRTILSDAEHRRCGVARKRSLAKDGLWPTVAGRPRCLFACRRPVAAVRLSELTASEQSSSRQVVHIRRSTRPLPDRHLPSISDGAGLDPSLLRNLSRGFSSNSSNGIQDHAVRTSRRIPSANNAAMVPNTNPQNATGTPSTRASGIAIASRARERSRADVAAALPFGIEVHSSASTTPPANIGHQFRQTTSKNLIVVPLHHAANP